MCLRADPRVERDGTVWHQDQRICPRLIDRPTDQSFFQVLAGGGCLVYRYGGRNAQPGICND